MIPSGRLRSGGVGNGAWENGTGSAFDHPNPTSAPKPERLVTRDRRKDRRSSPGSLRGAGAWEGQNWRVNGRSAARFISSLAT